MELLAGLMIIGPLGVPAGMGQEAGGTVVHRRINAESADSHIRDAGKEWFVDASVQASGDGKSPATAFKTLMEGLAAAGGGEETGGEKHYDTVWLAPGTYDGNIDYLTYYTVQKKFKGAIRGLGCASETVIQGLSHDLDFTLLSDVTILEGSGMLGHAWQNIDGIIERCIVKRCRLLDREDIPLAWVRDIRDSLFVENECSGTYSPRSAVILAERISNSTFVDNQAPLGLMDGYMDEATDEWVTCVALNCILWDNVATDYGDLGNYVVGSGNSWGFEGSEGTLLSNCCVNANSMCEWDESEEDYVAGRPDGREGLSVIFDNPMFVDAANGDYRLAEGSPCIDAGAPAWVVAGEKDVDGNARVSGEAPDIGCYEAVEAAGKEETETTPVAVPHSWLDDKAPGILAANGGDYEAAANAVASNGVNKVWQCYLAGLLPETDEVFIATYTWKDGEMVVTPKPDLGKERVYTVEAVEELGDENVWEERTARSRFFRIKVEMPVAGGAE